MHCLLACLFGMALTMSFAPARAWWFAPYCVAGLLTLLLMEGGWRRAAALGFSFGLGWFGAGFWWVLPALDNFSDAGMLFSFQLTAALVLYLALFPAVAAVLVARCRGDRARPLVTALRIALILALADWARGALFGGFPMLATGYAHTSGPLSGYAALIGVYGLGFLNSFVAALLAAALAQARARQSLQLWLRTAAPMIVLGAGGVLLQHVDWTGDTGRTLRLSLLQGNLPQQGKFTDAGLLQAVSRYRQLAIAAQGQLLVLPETALPMSWPALPPEVRQHFSALADARAATIVIGTVLPGAAPDSAALTNSALALGTGQGADNYRYDKQHLLPFAESLPNGTAWIGARLGMGANGLTAGRAGQAPLTVAGAPVALSICFEDLFDTAIASQAKHAELIVNMSNFAWFAGSYAPRQHLQVAQMRALETGRWLAQVANTGVTALIDEKGVIRQQLAPDQAGVLEGQAVLRSGRTPFMVLGNGPLLLAGVLAALLAIRRRKTCIIDGTCPSSRAEVIAGSHR